MEPIRPDADIHKLVARYTKLLKKLNNLKTEYDSLDRKIRWDIEKLRKKKKKPNKHIFDGVEKLECLEEEITIHTRQLIVLETILIALEELELIHYHHESRILAAEVRPYPIRFNAWW